MIIVPKCRETPDINKSIWNSLEFDCIARDFDYLQYLKLGEGHEHSLLSKDSYLTLCKIYHNEMCDYYGIDR